MIYLVSKNKELFKCNEYESISPEKAISKLEKETLLGADTETEGMSPYLKKLLTVQLGNENFQIVWDCLSYDVQLLKPILENPDIKTIWWNAKFDLQFLYHQRILPVNVYDGFIAEKLMYIGYPPGLHEMSLKAAGERYCNVELDKTVRGQIITKGLTPQVIIYAANDVKYEIPIYKAQQQFLEEKGLTKAVALENEFVKCLAYIEYCGVKLDVPRWRNKMYNDNIQVEVMTKVLNDWIIASQLGKEYITAYIPTYGRDIKDIKNDRAFKYLGERLPNEDLKYDCGSEFEAYKLPVFPINYPTPLYKYDLQGDLFSGYNKDPICTVNWASSKQVIPILKSIGFDTKEFNKTEKYKDSASGKVIAKQLDVSPFSLFYVLYKTFKKVTESFGQNYLNAINSGSGRIHTNFNQFGTDTCRLSSGGKPYNINLQQLPRNAETRACFTADVGYKWISSDYSSQESVLTADVTQDPTLLEVYQTGCKDMHSIIAKVAFEDELKDVVVEDVKKVRKDLRQRAKSVEFTIFYGGDGNTIAANLGIPRKEGIKMYNNVMKGLPGLKAYQEYCKKAIVRDGYILLCPQTGHKAFIYDFSDLKVIRDKLEDPEFLRYYDEMAEACPRSDTVQSVKHYNQRIKASEKQAIDYRIQGRGSLCFKTASILLFNYLKKNNLLFKVKYCIPVHDEINLEAPEDIAENISNILVECMKKGAEPYLKTLKLGADVEISSHWVH